VEHLDIVPPGVALRKGGTRLEQRRGGRDPSRFRPPARTPALRTRRASPPALRSARGESPRRRSPRAQQPPHHPVRRRRRLDDRPKAKPLPAGADPAVHLEHPALQLPPQRPALAARAGPSPPSAATGARRLRPAVRLRSGNPARSVATWSPSEALHDSYPPECGSGGSSSAPTRTAGSPSQPRSGHPAVPSLPQQLAGLLGEPSLTREARPGTGRTAGRRTGPS
jgi:hypothetical protein